MVREFPHWEREKRLSFDHWLIMAVLLASFGGAIWALASEL
jgi:hypothetical protein